MASSTGKRWFRTRLKKVPETGAYFDLVLNQRFPVEEAIQKAYGMSSAQMEDAVKAYLHSQTQLRAAVEAAPQPNAGGSSATNPAQPYQFLTPVSPDDSV